jgi:hypothetical protein
MKRPIPIATAILILLGCAALLVAQGKKEPQLRTVRGGVVDKEENPVGGGAIVYLKNLKSQTVKTQFAGEDGSYRFTGLDPNVDYEIHAEHNDLASAKRAISSFDTRKEIVIHLKLNKKRE